MVYSLFNDINMKEICDDVAGVEAQVVEVELAVLQVETVVVGHVHVGHEVGVQQERDGLMAL